MHEGSSHLVEPLSRPGKHFAAEAAPPLRRRRRQARQQNAVAGEQDDVAEQQVGPCEKRMRCEEERNKNVRGRNIALLRRPAGRPSVIAAETPSEIAGKDRRTQETALDTHDYPRV